MARFRAQNKVACRYLEIALALLDTILDMEWWAAGLPVARTVEDKGGFSTNIVLIVWTGLRQ